jgi:demethylmenaquinone methyltransferase/2-methoxy-6-polyprenyl-1,4-benzoquinol methylase
MFGDIAPRYDLANDVLSLGIARAWRRKAVKASGAKRGDRVLDVATGTGDLALAFRRRVGPEGLVVATDFTPNMIQLAKRKAGRKRAGMELAQADAQSLPYAGASFDVAAISFGIRNVDDPRRALSELARVVHPGGRVAVLEFGQPQRLWGRLYRGYARHVMPRIGGFLTGNRAAYQYLPRTAAAFPSGEAFVALMRQAHAWRDVQSRALSGGIAWLYVGTVA